MIKKYSLVLIAFLCFVVSGFGQTIFTNPITGTNPSSANPFTADQTVAANMTVSGIGRGAGITGSNASDRYNASSWAGTSSEANAVIQNEFFYFTLNPNSGYKINFSSFLCKYQKSNASNSPTNYAIRSSVDAYTTNIATGALLATGEQTMNTIDISAADFQEIDSSITFRLYAWSSGGGTGTFSINDFTFNGTVTSTSTDEVDFCNLQFPRSAIINLGESRDVYGQVYEDGVTPGDGPGAGIVAEIGYSTTNTNPNTWTNWIPASYNPLCLNCNGGQNDEYFADLGSVITNGGTYYYATRFSLNSGPYTYGGILDDGSAGNFWDGVTYVSGQLIVNGPSICLAEGFEGSTNDPSGWSNDGAYYQNSATNSYTGTFHAGMNDENDWIRTPLLSEPSSLSFWGRTSGTASNYTVRIQYSTNGTSWYDSSVIIADGTNSGDITTTYQQYNINLNLTGDYYIRWFMSARSGGSIYFDEVEITCGDSTPQPELQLVDAGNTNQNCGYTINFGNQALSSNTDISFTIENIGSEDLDVTSLNISGDYTLVTPPSTPLVIAPSGSQVITVRFTPTADGTSTATLTINNNDANESTCTVLLTGVGFTPAPRIRVERETEALIANGAAPNTGNNTIFAVTDLGNSSDSKLYYVRNGNATNPATANLTVNTISSSNNVEFTIINLPTLPVTLAPNEFISFEIEFSPNSTTPLTRNSIITVTSTDNNNNPYTFGVQGTAGCPIYSGNIMPTSGPVGTEITITSAENLLGATATLNGEALIIVTSSVEELVVRVPLTISLGGAISVTLPNGCSFTNTFQLIDKAIQSCEGTGGLDPSALFISQVTDSGRDSVTYIELYNGTGTSITDLSDYSIHIFNNGLASPLNVNYIIDLNNVSLPNGSTYTLALGTNVNGLECVSEHNFSNLADQQDAQSGVSINFFKDGNFDIGHDHIRLYNNSTHIDSWGVYLNQSWATSLNLQGKGANFQRRTDATLPNINYDNNDWIIQDWGNSCSDLDYSNIGIYDFSVGTPPTVSILDSPISDCDLSATLSITGTEGFDGNNPLTYQWYYSAPGELGWTAVPDNDIYDDVITNTLQILNTLSLNGYQYYCQVRENTVTCYTASNAIRLQVEKTTWNGSSWSPAPPDINTIAVINGDYNTSIGGVQTSFSACNLLVSSGELIIADNTFVQVENHVTVDGKIIVSPQGSFVQVNNLGLVNGAVLTDKTKVTVLKQTAPMNNWYEYTYWSSPVWGETISSALTDASPNRRFWYDAKNFLDSFKETGNNNILVIGQDDIDDVPDDWNLAPAGMTMLPGVGYASTHRQDVFVGPGIPPYRFTYSFYGPFNNGILNVPIYRNDTEMADNNWNFIGNPYPSAISVDNFLTANTVLDLNVTGGSIDGAIFLWSQNTAPLGTANGNENLNFAQSDYAIINGTGQAAGGDGVMPTRYIPSGQGFFVSMSNTATSSVYSGQIKTTNVTFNNAMRVTDNNNQFFRTSEQSIDDNKLWINLTSNNGVFNQILMGYVIGATDGNDGMYYDAAKNLSSGANSIIYTLIGENQDIKLGIQGKHPNSLNLNEVIPLGFYTSITEPTTYKLSIANIQGEFLTTNTIYLKDNLLNVTFNLSASEYIFSSQTGEYNNRFEIVFAEQSLSVIENEIPASGLTIYELPSGHVKFSVGNGLTIQAVTIIDMLGRTLYQLEGDNASEVYDLSNLSQAAYVAKVTLSNGQTITKRAVKRH